MARSTCDRATASLFRRSWFWLLEFRQPLHVRIRSRKAVQFPQAAQFAGIRRNHVVLVVVPARFLPSRSQPSPYPIPIDSKPSGQTHRLILVVGQPDPAAVPLTAEQSQENGQASDLFHGEPLRPFRWTESIVVQPPGELTLEVSPRTQLSQPHD